MVKITYLLLIISVAEIRAQFFDFLSAFQPQTLRPIFETRAPKTTRFHETDRLQNGNRQFQVPDHTTAKSIRKINKNNSRNQNKTKKVKDHYGADKISFDDGINTIINYETTTSPLARPGVKPAIANGPPITNRPIRPYIPRPIAGLHPDDDSSLTPELIVGPDEDYMTSAEKRRYMEMAETKCEQYVSLDTVRVEAIPLVPSPRPVVVNVSSCARSVPLVVGGSVVSIQLFPHMALLGWTKTQSGGYSWKCGGSLVSDRYVLTAAHCAYQDRDDSVVSGPPRAVQLGTSRRDDQGAIVIRVASVIRHPKYRPPQSYYDIAIVKMMKTVTFSAVIKPACLGVPPPPGEHIIATGWGKTEFGGDESEQLRGVSLPVWSLNECVSVLGQSRKLPHGPDASQTCAGDRRGGKDTCQGDSGGPAQRREGCSWRVVAVTSTGRACGAVDTPAIYANVQVPFVAKVVFGDDVRNEGSFNGQDSYNRRNSNSGQNGDNGQSSYNRQNSDSGQTGYNRQNSDSGQNNYNRQNSNSDQNTYNRQNGDNSQNSYNRQNSDSGQNGYNRQNSDSGQTGYNRQNSDSGQNNYNRQNSDSDQNSYNRQNGDNSQNSYNRQNSDSGQNGYNRQNSDSGQNTYNRPNIDSGQNSYNRRNGNSGQNRDNDENNYHRQNSDSGQNSYNRQNSDSDQNSYYGQNTNSEQNGYNPRNTNIGQNSFNRRNSQRNNFNYQNQWNQQTTSRPLRNQAWNYQNQDSGNRRNNYENPIDRPDRSDEDSTIGPNYFFEASVDRPYVGNIW